MTPSPPAPASTHADFRSVALRPLLETAHHPRRSPRARLQRRRIQAAHSGDSLRLRLRPRGNGAPDGRLRALRPQIVFSRQFSVLGETCPPRASAAFSSLLCALCVLCVLCVKLRFSYLATSHSPLLLLCFLHVLQAAPSRNGIGVIRSRGARFDAAGAFGARNEAKTGAAERQ